MKKTVLILIVAFVWSTGIVSASPHTQGTDAFSSDVQFGGTTMHFSSPNSKVLIATVERNDLTLQMIGRLDGHGRGRINFVASRSNGDVETGLLFLRNAESGDFSALTRVAEVVQQNVARGVAQMAIELVNSGRITGYQAHFLVAAMGALASQSPAKAAWPWDYVAYSVCYYSAVAGCEAGGGDAGYCWSSAEAQCSHYID